MKKQEIIILHLRIAMGGRVSSISLVGRETQKSDAILPEMRGMSSGHSHARHLWIADLVAK
jgi:hypothetical protein